MTLETWRKDALAHYLWVLYAMEAADEAERLSGGVLRGLGAKVRQAVEQRRAV